MAYTSAEKISKGQAIITKHISQAPNKSSAEANTKSGCEQLLTEYARYAER